MKDLPNCRCLYLMAGVPSTVETSLTSVAFQIAVVGRPPSHPYISLDNGQYLPAWHVMANGELDRRYKGKKDLYFAPVGADLRTKWRSWYRHLYYNSLEMALFLRYPGQ